MRALSKAVGIGGRIKAEPEDFVVEEITKNGTALETGRRYGSVDIGVEESDGNFAVFVLQKRNWNTVQALRTVARLCARGMKSVGFAGTKDRAAVSTQLCSLFGASPERLLSLHVKDISINGAWKSATGVELGDLLGNRFTVVVRDPGGNAGDIGNVAGELGGVFPNYFGEQRFGFRQNNVKVGAAMMRGDFEGAAMEFLTGTANETDEEAVSARRRLASETDFSAALSYFPRHLKYERGVLGYLSKYPNNYANALRKLPRQLSLMFVHSVESYIFNRELELRVASGETAPGSGDLLCGADAMGFPDMESAGREGGFIVGNVVGYETDGVNEAEKGIMEELGITPSSFKIQAMPELSCKGSRRVMFAPYLDFSCKVDDAATLTFSLPAGSYATVLLNEFMKR